MTAKAQGRTLYTCRELTCPVITFITGGDALADCPVCKTTAAVLVSQRDRERPAPRDPSGLPR